MLGVEVSACEKCWGDAYMRSLSRTEKDQADHYRDILAEREGHPCTPDQQEGTWWIAVAASVVGNPERGFVIAYSSDLRKCASREAAVLHGFETLDRSDDFHVMRVKPGDGVVAVFWMDKNHNESAETCRDISDQLGLS